MGADQFDDYEPKERLQKLSSFNWWMFSIFLGTLFSNTFLIYIQDNVGWSVGYALPTTGIAVAIMVFIAGTRYYRHKPSLGSPLTQMARVLVATVRKWGVVSPHDPKQLYELPLDEYSSAGHNRLDHTPCLRQSSRGDGFKVTVDAVTGDSNGADEADDENDPNPSSNIHTKHHACTNTHSSSSKGQR
ncbi:hypothetical protein SASPL_107130 [Salvia splendens]|uniref:Solute carrier family 15 (Peptide/histidine transporter), member 3/4 n=1 Tax=Salvia splendens TaxID=180675 RepID=A0A8X8YFW5_SALSN|nr:hypothetical protein SASPL_107130 [Salvia splendens]